MSALSSVGSAPCVFTRRRNSSFSRSMALVVRNVFHCVLGKLKKVSSSGPPSYASIRPAQLKRAVAFYEGEAVRVLGA